MHNFKANFRNRTTGSGLHCVWVAVRDDGGDRLVSVWIDLGPATFKSPRQGTSCGIDPAVTPSVQREEQDGEGLDTENLRCVLPFRR
jgi:hypothetical protein